MSLHKATKPCALHLSSMYVTEKSITCIYYSNNRVLITKLIGPLILGCIPSITCRSNNQNLHATSLQVSGLYPKTAE